MFKKGDKVRCVNADDLMEHCPQLVVDAVYTVYEDEYKGFGKEPNSVKIVCPERDSGYFGYYVSRFVHAEPQDIEAQLTTDGVKIGNINIPFAVLDELHAHSLALRAQQPKKLPKLGGFENIDV